MNTIRQLIGVCLLVAASSLSLNAFAGVSQSITGNVVSVHAGSNDTVNLAPSAVVSSLNAFDQATVNVAGSTVSWSYLYDQSVLNVTGDAAMSWLLLYDSSTANIDDGRVSWLKLYQSSRANLRSVDSLSWLLLNDQSQVHIYGKNFQYGGGHLSGSWANGIDFSFWALNERELANQSSNRSLMPAGIRLHVVPEPIALSLVAAAGPLAWMRRRRLSP